MASYRLYFSATRRVFSNRKFAIYTAGNFVSLVATVVTGALAASFAAPSVIVILGRF